ncbi:MAG: hypothetical protein LH702_09340 [Phormidesmis sp. CAN_BIN44]|nr:hypothetical protein [Phormidesmis sp. CAN_BIN44]
MSQKFQPHQNVNRLPKSARSRKSRRSPFPIGRIFRKLGLPPWTFLGVGISAIWFNYFGSLFEKLLRDLLKLNQTPTNWLDYVPPLVVFLFPFGILLLLGIRQNIQQRNHSGFVGGGLQCPAGKRGLILLVSNPDSAMYAIAFHHQQGDLERVWLLPSDGSDAAQFGASSLPAALKIQQRCAQTFPGLQVEVMRQGVSPADSQDTFDLVNRIYRQSRHEPSELIADFTGGTKPMAVGMIMACLPAERELEYVSYTKDGGSQGPFVVDYQHRAFDLIG